MTVKGILQLLVVAILLIGFPLGSWYYLQSGLDYRIEVMDDLEDHGKLPTFQFTNFNGDRINKDSFENRLLVAQFFSLENEQQSQQFGKYLKKLHEQFDDRNEVAFVSFPIGADSSSLMKVSNFIEQYELNDPAQCYFLMPESQEIEQVAKKDFKLPLTSGMDLNKSPYFILTDTSHTIRKFYNVKEEEEVKRMVEHIALLLPWKERADIEFRREKEK